MDFKKYLRLKKECESLERQIRREEKRLARAECCRVRVISSMHEAPYIKTHANIEGDPDTWTLTKLKAKYRFAELDALEAYEKLDDLIYTLDEPKERMFLHAKYIDGQRSEEIGKEWQIKKCQVDNIIRKAKQKLQLGELQPVK